MYFFEFIRELKIVIIKRGEISLFLHYVKRKIKRRKALFINGSMNATAHAHLSKVEHLHLRGTLN